jgi:hypothetical protein
MCCNLWWRAIRAWSARLGSRRHQRNDQSYQHDGSNMHVLFRLAIAAWVFGAGPCAAQQQAMALAPIAPHPQQTWIAIVTLAVLIKGTVTALDQANATGNYSVLRDLGTPAFREKFDQGALAETFAEMKARKLDLSQALLANPNVTRRPEFRNGEMTIIGYFPAEPLNITFDLRFAQLDGVWRVASIGVDAVPPANQALAAAKAPAETRPPAKTARKMSWKLKK